jgi:NAD+ diphosphatase
VNFLGGSPLNRLSWLRASPSFLNALALSPSTRWVVFDAGQPLITAHRQSGLRNIAFLSTEDIRSCLGPQPFFGQGQGESDVAPAGVPALESARLRGPPIVFLGLQQTPEDAENALPLSETKDAQYSVDKIKGAAFFALDVQRLDRRAVDDLLKNSERVQGELLLEFMEPRSAMIFLDDFAASLFATGRSLLDWSQSNKVCIRCFYCRADSCNVNSSVPRAGHPRILSGQDGRYPAHRFSRGWPTQTESPVAPR